MNQEEALKRVDHYRCRRCGQESPITATNCTRATCGAQLGLYGEIVFGEDNRIVEEPSERTQTPKENPAAKTKPHWEKVRKETFAQPQSQLQGSFLPKKTLLIWLDVILLPLYVIMVNAANWAYMPIWEDAVGLLCIGLLLLMTAVEIFLARRDKFVARGLVGILQAFLCFMISGYFYSYSLPEAIGIFLGMPALYLWKAVLSFVGTSKKRRALAASGQAPDFMSKKALLMWLNLVLSLIGCIVFAFNRDINGYYLEYDGMYSLYSLLLAAQGVLLIAGFLFARKEKYRAWGIALCIYGAVVVLLSYISAVWDALLLPLLAVGVLHIALGILAYGKIRKEKE